MNIIPVWCVYETIDEYGKDGYDLRVVALFKL